MKELSVYTEAAIDSPYVRPIRLVEITIGSKTLYLCDRVFGDGNLCTFNDQLYEPFILDHVKIRTGKIDPITNETEPGDASFVVDNSKPIGGSYQFTALFASDDPQYSTITISEIYEGATAAADKIVLFVGKLEDMPEMSQTRILVTCSGFELDIANKFDHNIITTTNYPGADPDDLGKMLPVSYSAAAAAMAARLK